MMLLVSMLGLLVSAAALPTASGPLMQSDMMCTSKPSYGNGLVFGCNAAAPSAVDITLAVQQRFSRQSVQEQKTRR